jgi:hypothetical protein
MKIKLIFFLILFGFIAKAQETPPPFDSNFKQLTTSSFYIQLPDSAIWQYKGAPYGWARIGRYADVITKVDKTTTLTINGVTFDLSENRTFTIPTADTIVYRTTANSFTLAGGQPRLVSGTNIKTINSTTLLGTGDIITGTVQSITPAYGFTSTTPITTSGTLIIDTTSASGLVSKTRLTGALTSKADLVSGKVPFNQLTFNTEKTGLSQGGLLTINVDNTKFDVASGFGYIVNGHSDPEQPTTTKVTWSDKIANTIPNLATQKTTYVAIDINGDLFLTANPLTATQRRNYIRLGVLVHLDNTVLSYIDNQPVVNLEIGGQVQDILEAFGFKSLSGNRIFPVSTNMKIKKEAGKVFKSGANFNNLTTQPHTFDLTAQNPITFRYRTQTGAEGVDITDINPAIYDVNGTITAMPATATLATIQRVYVFQDNVIRIQPGQRFFNNLNEAVTAINSDVFITNDDISDNGLYLGAIVLIRGTTNLSLLAQAIFVPSIGTTTNGSTAAAPLGYTPEDVANKQNNLTVDGTGAKYPTVDAVNTALSAKENILTFSLPIQRAGSTVVMPAANTSIDGYLTSTNFNTFNNKQPAGSYATLTGTEILTNKSISGGQITSAVANATLAASVTTNANLTGVVTSTGNATLIGDAALSIAKTSGLQTALDNKAPANTETLQSVTDRGFTSNNSLVINKPRTSTNSELPLIFGSQNAGGTFTSGQAGVYHVERGSGGFGQAGGLRFKVSINDVAPFAAMDIFETGNVGIGFTTNQGDKLSVNGTARAINFGANIAPNINFGFTGSASTSTSAPFLVTGGVAYTGTQAGALWYENTNQRIRFFGATATDLIKSDNNFLLEGLSVRVVTANPVGGVVAVTPIIEQFTTVAEVITAITGATYSSNRATITPASSKVFLKGQFYDDGTFTYLAIADNSVRRF